MIKPLEGLSSKNKLMHYSVGAIIEKDGAFLLIDRAKPPYGFASIAGHIDFGENETEALKREVMEESGLKVLNQRLILKEEFDWNECSRGIGIHYWYVFRCDVEGEIKNNFAETKSIGWYNIKQIKKLKLESVWDYLFKKLKIIE